MPDQVRVRVPATSANLGPGFDTFGLALTLYDDLVVTPAGSGVTVEVTGSGEGEVPLDESHLVVRSIRAGLEALGVPVPGFTLRCENRIPHGRGLGSSSAAIVGGLAAAYGLAGVPVDRDRIVVLANEIEGHPDNVAAAALGGFTIAWTEGDVGRAIRLDPVDGLAAVAYVPDNRVLTKEARGLLPGVVSHIDASANAGKAALLVAAMTTRPELLLIATEDRLHQEYREPAMPESLALVHKLRGSGLAAIVSGAGPTVAVLGRPDETSAPAGKAAGQPAFFRGTPDAPDGWTRYDLGIDPVGVQVWSMESG
ncbi:homoserine kinase [Kribbella capetownensis]|uniref:Homoserine kinase n=1 Tax=Kribbella capetownensis TaxID=1572659 RepID=A0A4R0JBL8_9ACTN|nr:homoserine kinase [Kribbella capetownensis]TCC42814.1 homoserine kinase [Kribbella capetownensis]